MQGNASDLVLSWVRTVVPLGVGLVISWLVAHNVISDASVAQPLTDVIVFAITAGYYTLVRVLEHLWAPLGFFLGAPKMPVYGSSSPTATQPMSRSRM